MDESDQYVDEGACSHNQHLCLKIKHIIYLKRKLQHKSECISIIDGVNMMVCEELK